MGIRDNILGIMIITLAAVYLPITARNKSNLLEEEKKTETSKPQKQDESASKLETILGEFSGTISTKEENKEKWQLVGSGGSILKIERQPGKSLENAVINPKILENQSLKFLIATLPDPIDSHTGWLFDQFLDAIQRAFEHSGYQIDRYWLPWKHDSKSTEYREKPGIILFRKESSPPLVLFIVGETPTAGIHKAPFEIALSEIQRYSGLTNKLWIGVLGPSFSGSVTSIRNAIQSWLKSGTRPVCNFDFVSGSATAITKENFKDILSNDQGSVKFQPTVRNEYELLMAIWSALRWQNGGKQPGRLALLTESNTAYGQSIDGVIESLFEPITGFENDLDKPLECRNTIKSLTTVVKQLEKNRGDPDAKQEVQSELNQVKIKCASSFDKTIYQKIDAGLRTFWDYQNFIELPFPLHISGLRSEYEKNKELGTERVDKSKNPQIGLDLSLHEEGEPQDVIPPMSPQITSSTGDLVLSNILSTINNEGVRYVGLFATDTRDKLFLAEQIRLNCPNVQLFTTESDLLYSHPKYVRFTRGMIVASTYPLTYLNQKWTCQTGAGRKHLQFVTSSSQGVFNAVLKLLDNPDVPWMEYSSPTYSKKALPPVWITAVGYRGPVPLWLLQNFTTVDYLPSSPSGRNSHRMEFKPLESQFFNLILFLFCIFASVHFSGFIYQNRKNKVKSINGVNNPPSDDSEICRFWFDTLRMADRKKCLSLEQLFYLFLLFSLLLILCFRMTMILCLWQFEGDKPVKIFAIITLILLVYTSVCLTIKSLMCLKNSWLRILLFLGFWAPVSLYIYYLSAWFVKMNDLARVFFYLRAGDPLNGLSPFVPILLLSTIFYLWLILQIKQKYLWRTSDVKKELSAVSEISNGDIENICSNFEKLLTKTVFQHPILAPLILFIIGVVYLHVNHRIIPTIEGAKFTVELKVLLFASFILVLIALSKFIALSYNFLRLTRALAAHPIVEAYSRVPTSLTKDLGRNFYIRRPTLQQLALTRDQAKKVLTNHPPDFQRYRDSLKENLHKYGTGHAWCDNPAYDEYTDLWPKVETAVRTQKLVDPKWKEAAEEFLVTRIVFFFREMFIHMRNYLVFATLGALLILAAISYYPIQPKRLLMMFLINLILVISGYSFFIFVQFSRDEILSRLFGTTINKVSWDKSFVFRMILYVLFPILTLIAAQFPEIGSLLVSILDPIQKALP